MTHTMQQTHCTYLLERREGSSFLFQTFQISNTTNEHMSQDRNI